MSVVVENVVNISRINRRVHWDKFPGIRLTMSRISIDTNVSSWWWKYSGGGAGFSAPVAVLILNAVRAALGLLSRRGALAFDLPRWKSGRVVGQAASGRLGASDATAA